MGGCGFVNVPVRNKKYKYYLGVSLVQEFGLPGPFFLSLAWAGSERKVWNKARRHVQEIATEQGITQFSYYISKAS
jgi:hypothetical protein